MDTWPRIIITYLIPIVPVKTVYNAPANLENRYLKES